MDHVFIGIYILEKKKINVVKSEKKNYLIPENGLIKIIVILMNMEYF